MDNNNQVVEQLLFYDNYIPIEFNNNKNSTTDQKSYYEKEFPFLQESLQKSCIKCSSSQTKTQPKKRNKKQVL